MQTVDIKGFLARNKTSVISSVVTAIVVLAIAWFLFSMGGANPIPYSIRGIVSDSSSPNYELKGAIMGEVVDSVERPAPGASVSVTDRKVIKNGSLSLVVKNTDTAIAQVKTIATNLKGFVSNANVYRTSEDRKAGSVSIRVPSASFNTAIVQIKNIAVTVENESVNANDVTEQYIDYKARLKNLKAEEASYVLLMSRAGKLGDVLDVAGRLADVRGRIESLEGQLKYLSQQVDMSTINVNLVSEADVEVFGVVWSPLTVLKQSIKNALIGLVDYVNYIVGIIFFLPVIIVWVLTVILALVVLWKIMKIGKRRWFNKENKK